MINTKGKVPRHNMIQQLMVYLRGDASYFWVYSKWKIADGTKICYEGSMRIDWSKRQNDSLTGDADISFGRVITEEYMDGFPIEFPEETKCISVVGTSLVGCSSFSILDGRK
jgi:hypothetical protein